MAYILHHFEKKNDAFAFKKLVFFLIVVSRIGCYKILKIEQFLDFEHLYLSLKFLYLNDLQICGFFFLELFRRYFRKFVVFLESYFPILKLAQKRLCDIRHFWLIFFVFQLCPHISQNRFFGRKNHMQ